MNDHFASRDIDGGSIYYLKRLRMYKNIDYYFFITFCELLVEFSRRNKIKKKKELFLHLVNVANEVGYHKAVVKKYILSKLRYVNKKLTRNS